jgi:hypothetical protein
MDATTALEGLVADLVDDENAGPQVGTELGADPLK